MNHPTITSRKPQMHSVPPLSESPHMKDTEISKTVFLLYSISGDPPVYEPLRVYKKANQAVDAIAVLKGVNNKTYAVVGVPFGVEKE